jgi:predicted DCC family thiol-disulfide oxidoreductase YuxK
VQVPLPRPLLIYDGDCSFCKRWIARWRHLTVDAIDYEPYQTASERAPHIPRENFGRAVHLIEPGGATSRGAEAVFRSLALGGHHRYLLWLYEHVPAFEGLAEALYAFVASHRDPLDRIDRIVVGTETRAATHVLTRALFLRALGVIYLIAFTSLYVQIDGLVGSNGILPASALVEAATRTYGASRWWNLPTLAYLSSSDAFLHALCIGGIVCSCLLIVGLLPMVMTILLFAGYLSLSTVGQIFLGYQWDALLLETGFLAILFSPPLWLGSRNKPPSRLMLFMLRWLLFRLMFLSALVKWFGDEAWRNMSALRFHFETQPIPTSTAWHAHQSPPWLLSIACFCMFITEAIVPLLYFAPRRTRMLAFWLTVLLQVNIMLTGNYGFFNLLTIVLALTLLDDAAVGRLTRMTPPPYPRSRPWMRRWVIVPIALVLFIVGLMAGIERVLMARLDWPRPLAALQRAVEPFEIANHYGLFAAMTKTRPEIIIEGSDDRLNWKAYEFKWKPTDVNRRPAFCEPHMPRLDWQMWFAALDPQGNQNWFLAFAVKLLEGQPEVLKLMEKNPFPQRPPKYIRAVVYDYHFSDRAARARSGAWWVRKEVGVLLEPISIRQ